MRFIDMTFIYVRNIECHNLDIVNKVVCTYDK